MKKVYIFNNSRLKIRKRKFNILKLYLFFVAKVSLKKIMENYKSNIFLAR